MLNFDLSTIISRVIILVISLSMHEFAHAWTATRLGDDTPRWAGRLTLNPLAHLDPIGSLMLILVGFGWAKPVPINPATLRRNHKAGVMLVSLAGPTTNLLLAGFAAILYRFMPVGISNSNLSIFPSASLFLIQFIYTNVALFLFNMLPFAPLDGEKVLDFLLPSSWRPGFARFRQYSPYILLFIVFIGPRIGFDIFGKLIREPLMKIVTFLIGN